MIRMRITSPSSIRDMRSEKDEFIPPRAPKADEPLGEVGSGKSRGVSV